MLVKSTINDRALRVDIKRNMQNLRRACELMQIESIEIIRDLEMFL